MIEVQNLVSSLDGSMQAQLVRYAELLAEENSRARLTGPKDESELLTAHLYECLPLVSPLPQGGRILDLGTGGGLPGLVLALCRPDCQFVLLDSLKKKIDALERIVSALGVRNVSLVCARSEDYAGTCREQFDAAVARAVTAAGELAELLAPFVRPGGVLLMPKGPAWRDETVFLAGRWAELSLSEPQAVAYQGLSHQGWILSFQKLGPLKDRYPRRVGRATKRGWWLR